MSRPNVQTESLARTQFDQLPPYAESAEAAILGCVLVDPNTANQVLLQIGERFAGAQPFYDLRHATIFDAMQRLQLAGHTPDLITLQQALFDAGKLESVGGLAYLSGLADKCVPGLLSQYLDTVWTKHLARAGIRAALSWAADLDVAGAMDDRLLLAMRTQVEFIEREASRHQATPKLLKQPLDFADSFWARFFGTDAEEPGLDLPIDFKLRIRPEETTLVTGDDGSGKSTVLSYFALHLAQAGARVAVASFEMPPAVTLWILASQLLGAKRQPDATAGQLRVRNALAWLHKRFFLYDFLGIGDWRDVLDTFRYAATKLGVNLFVLDSVMRIGIADDDYATQGIVAARFAQFCKDHVAHLFFVIHENKGDAKGKARIRGSKLWSANADNVLRVERNAEKAEKVSKAEWQIKLERQSDQPDQDEIQAQEKKIAEARKQWDTHFVLQKQRYPGTQQNGSRFVFFDSENFQLRTQQSDPPVNWLERWATTKPNEKH